jgi:hypothetical protein
LLVFVVVESCVFGDQTGEVVTGFTCASLIAQKPYQCYTLAVAQQCCQSCNTIATNITGMFITTLICDEFKLVSLLYFVSKCNVS